MNTDFRVDVNFFQNLKIIRLQKECGEAAVTCLLRLWAWVAVNRPSGTLSGVTREELDALSGYSGEGSFCDRLERLRLLDKEDGQYTVHGWREFQQWAAWDGEREGRARLSALAARNKAAYNLAVQDGKKSITKADYARYVGMAYANSQSGRSPVRSAQSRTPAPSPLPSPAPSPSPSPDVSTERGASSEQKDKDGLPSSLGSLFGRLASIANANAIPQDKILQREDLK